MAEVTVWFNPDCAKCRSACDLLDARGIEPSLVPYLDSAPGRPELERILDMLGTDDPRAIVRSGEPVYGALGLDRAGRDELMDAMVANPILIERPIVIVGQRAVVARPPERLLELLDQGSD